MNWYYVEQGQQAGPVEDAQLEEMRRSGRIQADTLVWREGMTDWVPYNQAKGQSQTPASPPPVAAPMGDPAEAVCTECGNIFPKDEMIRYGGSHVCRNCKPVFMQKLSEGARINTGALEYAGFWIRLLAKILDGLVFAVIIFVPILLLILVIVGFSPKSNFGMTPADYGLRATSSAEPALLANLLGLMGQFVIYGLQVIYSTFFNGKYGATPGKMICQLKIVDSDGRSITYGRAFGRGCAELLSNFICSIGYIIAAFDSQKRALHDHICNTRVVYKR